jgi:putative ABC transport system permease protein
MMIAAFIVGAPAAWVVLHRWMQSYAVPAEIPVWPFLLTGTIALIVALGTVTVHALRAATVDPAAVLRAE